MRKGQNLSASLAGKYSPANRMLRNPIMPRVLSTKHFRGLSPNGKPTIAITEKISRTPTLISILQLIDDLGRKKYQFFYTIIIKLKLFKNLSKK